MRPRDILAGIKSKLVRYTVEYTGISQSEQRRLEAEERRGRRGPARMKPRNWAKDRSKRRREQKRRRKQSWR